MSEADHLTRLMKNAVSPKREPRDDLRAQIDRYGDLGFFHGDLKADELDFVGHRQEKQEVMPKQGQSRADRLAQELGLDKTADDSEVREFTLIPSDAAQSYRNPPEQQRNTHRIRGQRVDGGWRGDSMDNPNAKDLFYPDHAWKEASRKLGRADRLARELGLTKRALRSETMLHQVGESFTDSKGQRYTIKEMANEGPEEWGEPRYWVTIEGDPHGGEHWLKETELENLIASGQWKKQGSRKTADKNMPMGEDPGLPARVPEGELAGLPPEIEQSLRSLKETLAKCDEAKHQFETLDKQMKKDRDALMAYPAIFKAVQSVGKLRIRLDQDIYELAWTTKENPSYARTYPVALAEALKHVDAEAKATVEKLLADLTKQTTSISDIKTVKVKPAKQSRIVTAGIWDSIKGLWEKLTGNLERAVDVFERLLADAKKQPVQGSRMFRWNVEDEFQQVEPYRTGKIVDAAVERGQSLWIVAWEDGATTSVGKSELDAMTRNGAVVRTSNFESWLRDLLKDSAKRQNRWKPKFSSAVGSRKTSAGQSPDNNPWAEEPTEGRKKTASLANALWNFLQKTMNRIPEDPNAEINSMTMQKFFAELDEPAPEPPMLELIADAFLHGDRSEFDDLMGIEKPMDESQVPYPNEDTE